MNMIATPGNTHQAVTLFEHFQKVSRPGVTAISRIGEKL
jgi:hypothetical protein